MMGLLSSLAALIIVTRVAGFVLPVEEIVVIQPAALASTPLPGNPTLIPKPTPTPSSTPAAAASPRPTPHPLPATILPTLPPVPTPSPIIIIPPVPTLTVCGNGADNSGGLGLICETVIVNTATDATVTIRECHGAAGDPTALCTTVTTVLADPVTAVNQCNASINGGGGTLRCSVLVTFVGVAAGAAATVNQCVGSGGGITADCAPLSSTVGAAITQCNGSANGGTLVGLTCTGSGTQSATHPVTIGQCNGSANGGGALVICSARLQVQP